MSIVEEFIRYHYPSFRIQYSIRGWYDRSMRVLIFGGRGFLAKHLIGIYPDALLPDTDIADQMQVRAVLESSKPDVVINAAGKTGRPNVDWCEDHKPETVRSNVTGPLILLEECARLNMYWVHIGSGCIYQGDNGGKGFAEDDPPNFSGSFYARTKAWSDQILRDFPVLQLRLRMPFDGSEEPRNLIMKLRNYRRILDEPNSLTYVPDFLKAARYLIGQRKTGIYNVVNPGAISPYQIMQRYQEIVDPAFSFERLALADLPDVVKAGRSNCILSPGKLASAGIESLSVETAIDEALAALA